MEAPERVRRRADPAFAPRLCRSCAAPAGPCRVQGLLAAMETHLEYVTLNGTLHVQRERDA